MILEPQAERVELRASYTMNFLRFLGLFNLLWLFKQHLRNLFDSYQTSIKVELCIRRIRKFVQKLDLANVYFYLIRSAGAILASRLALKFPVKAIFILAYPFIHPNYGMLTYRLKYLVILDKPMNYSLRCSS